MGHPSLLKLHENMLLNDNPSYEILDFTDTNECTIVYTVKFNNREGYIIKSAYKDLVVSTVIDKDDYDISTMVIEGDPYQFEDYAILLNIEEPVEMFPMDLDEALLAAGEQTLKAKQFIDKFRSQ